MTTRTELPGEPNAPPEHTPEPWKLLPARNIDSPVGGSNPMLAVGMVGAGSVTAYVSDGWPLDEQVANGERIVACVNACQGINPEAVKDMLEYLQRLSAAADTGQEIPGVSLDTWFLADLRTAIAKAAEGGQ